MARLETRVCPACGQMKTFRVDVKTCGCKGTNPFRVSAGKPEVAAPKDVAEIELQKLRDKREGKDAVISELRERVVLLEEEREAILHLQDTPPEVTHIAPKTASGQSESAMVVVASDWHEEERVLPEHVGGKNEYNLDIQEARFRKWLHGVMAWWKIASRDTLIKTIVLALLGDFISGSIHDDIAENNLLPPAVAIHRAYSQIVSAIKFLLENIPNDVQIVVPCHSGNHGRMTKEQRIATEAGNSLEYFMYLMLRDYFQDEKRLTFIVSGGYHSYVTFFEGIFDVRFHHGHQINYWGGVGGITIPVNKAIAQWNVARPVDLDVFGHFHQKFDGGNFICNGSMIGYNAFAVSVKARYEKPEQQLFLINREYGEKTMVSPIFLE